MNFGMMQHHNWSLTELEEMIPWEREIYIGLLMNYLEEEKKRQEQQKFRGKEKKRQDSQLSPAPSTLLPHTSPLLCCVNLGEDFATGRGAGSLGPGPR